MAVLMVSRVVFIQVRSLGMAWPCGEDLWGEQTPEAFSPMHEKG